ncbi:MAG: glycoside hydrolase, family 24 [Mucilaginibacter sp.]|nr:glycoside hydrolase, family 24 [Mucilaginibacter sp.]
MALWLTQVEIDLGTYWNRSITQEEAATLLDSDMQFAVSSVQRNIRVPLTQNQFDALVSFTFQQGSSGFANSSVNTLVNSGRYLEAASALRNFSNVSADGRVHRRGEEADLFLRSDYAFAPY